VRAPTRTKNLSLTARLRGIAGLPAIPALLFSLTACFQTPYSTTATIRLPDGAGGAAVLSSAVEASGRVSGAFDPSAPYAQALAAASGAIAGTEVVFPPGALSIAADIYVEHGSDLSSSSALSDLGLAASNAVAAAGAAAIIRPSSDAELKNPMSLSLPLPAGFSLSLELAASSVLGLGDASERVAILAKVWDPGSKELRTVLIPRNEINVENGFAVFDTMYFGVFQTVVMENPVTGKIEAKASEPITNNSGIAVVATTGIVPQESIATTETLRPLTVAGLTLTYSWTTRTASLTARTSESVKFSSCVFSARDKTKGTVLWSTSSTDIAATSGLTLTGVIPASISGPLEGSVSCSAVDGRATKSSWEFLGRACAAGQFGSECVACAAGMYWDMATSSCVNAGTGYYATGDGVRRSCNARPDNATFASATESTPDCAYTCNNGFFGPTCLGCAAGTYWDTTTSSCVNAGLGYYSNGDGTRRACDAKPAESVYTSAQATSATCPYACNAGFFGTTCSSCPAGRAWNTDTSSCEDAGPGFYASGDGVKRTCDAKPADSTYSSATATSSNCPYTCNSSRYGTSCVACAAGTWWNQASLSCAEVGTGYYANGDGNRYVCDTIPSNAAYTNTRATSAACEYSCATGYWGASCVACPAGKWWSGAACSDVGTGYFSTGNGVRQACTNTLAANASYSSTSATSSTCPWSCATGYTSDGNTCVGAPPTLGSDELQITTTTASIVSFTHKAATDPTGGNVTYRVYMSTNQPAYGSFASTSSVEAGTFLTTYTLPSGTNMNSVSLSGGNLATGIRYINVVAISQGGGRVAYRPAGVYVAAPLVYLPFNGNNNDASSNANAFVPQPANSLTTPNGSDRFGLANRAYSFDGYSQWGYTTNNTGISGTGSRTLAYWVKPQASYYNDAKVIAAWGAAGNLGLFGSFISGTSYTMWGWGTDYSANASMSGSGTWEHHALTYNENTWRFYKNGAQTSAISTTLYTSNGKLTLGTGPEAAGYSDHARYFAGSMDEVYLFNWPMGATEIAALYNVTRP
jgi:hypothetical protein